LFFFRAYLHHKWTDLRQTHGQTKTKMINGPFYTWLNKFHRRKCAISDVQLSPK